MHIILVEFTFFYRRRQEKNLSFCFQEKKLNLKIIFPDPARFSNFSIFFYLMAL